MSRRICIRGRAEPEASSGSSRIAWAPQIVVVLPPPREIERPKPRVSLLRPMKEFSKDKRRVETMMFTLKNNWLSRNMRPRSWWGSVTRHNAFLAPIRDMAKLCSSAQCFRKLTALMMLNSLKHSMNWACIRLSKTIYFPPIEMQMITANRSLNSMPPRSILIKAKMSRSQTSRTSDKPVRHRIEVRWTPRCSSQSTCSSSQARPISENIRGPAPTWATQISSNIYSMISRGNWILLGRRIDWELTFKG